MISHNQADNNKSFTQTHIICQYATLGRMWLSVSGLVGSLVKPCAVVNFVPEWC